MALIPLRPWRQLIFVCLYGPMLLLTCEVIMLQYLLLSGIPVTAFLQTWADMLLCFALMLDTITTCLIMSGMTRGLFKSWQAAKITACNSHFARCSRLCPYAHFDCLKVNWARKSRRTLQDGDRT